MTATPEQLRTYLTDRGWIPPDQSPRGLLQHPSGRTANLVNLQWQDQAGYDFILAEIGRLEGRAVLNVMLDIEGRQGLGDFTALDAAIETWRRVQEEPAAAASRTETEYQLHRTSPEQRLEVLTRMRDELDQVIATLDAAAETAAPNPGHTAVIGSRAKVWERELIVEPWFDRWPSFMRERIIMDLVAEEASLMTHRLDTHIENQRIPYWEWDPDLGGAVYHAGDAKALSLTDIDAMVVDVRQHLKPRRIEAAAARRWISDFPYSENPDAKALTEQYLAEAYPELPAKAVDAVTVLAHRREGTAAAADMGARHLAWEDHLAQQEWFTRWPFVIRARILDEIVDAETDLMTDALDTRIDPLSERTNTWEWDPRTGEVRIPWEEEPAVPFGTQLMLAGIRAEIQPRLIETSVAVGWIANAANDPALPTDLQLAAYEFFGNHAAVKVLSFPIKRELPDPMAQQILDLLERTYRPGATVPGPFFAPADGMTPPTVALAFPDTAAAIEPGSELEQTDHVQVEHEEGPVR